MLERLIAYIIVVLFPVMFELRCDQKLKQAAKEALWKDSEERQDVLKLFTDVEARKRRYI